MKHDSWVHGVAFSPDGLRIASASRDETVGIWEVRTGECVDLFRDGGDVEVLTAGAAVFPVRALARGQVMVIEDARSGDLVAAFPRRFVPIGWSAIATHPLGHRWVGAVHNDLCLIQLEGQINP